MQRSLWKKRGCWMPKIKQMREQRGLTQLQLAEMLQVTRPMISYIESYACLPTPRIMEELLIYNVICGMLQVICIKDNL